MASLPPIQGALFDVGYTLMDESSRLDEALSWMAERLAERGRRWTPDALHERYVRACEGPEADEPSVFVQMLRGLGLGEEEAKYLRRELPWDAAPLMPYPDAHAALRSLRDAGVRVGVLANQPASARKDLEHAGLAALCDHIWLSEAVGMSKPDPAFFRLALSVWQVPAQRVAYVGDRPDNDVASANAMGLRTVLLRRGPHAGQPLRDAPQTPDVQVHSLGRAAAYLREHAALSA